MDVFKVHRGVIGQYSAYFESFAKVSESPCTLKTREHTEYGKYRIRQLFLAAWDAERAGSPRERPGQPATALPYFEPVPAIQLPDLSLATEGAFSQHLKQAQKLSKNPSPTDIAELTVYLAAPENALCWLASATLSKIGCPAGETALNALLDENIGDDARQEAEKILAQS